MTRPRPSSEPRAGLFVTIDGPSGVGKTTTITHLAQLLRADNITVHLTAEPSRGPIGRLAYDLTDTVAGPALACLYAADRYHHLETEIRPHREAGHLVLCDRYVPSALVMQRLDGLEAGFLWSLNSRADRPHLSVILTADAGVIAACLAAKGHIIGCNVSRTAARPKPTSTRKPTSAFNASDITLCASTQDSRHLDSSRSGFAERSDDNVSSLRPKIQPHAPTGRQQSQPKAPKSLGPGLTAGY